MLCKKGMTIITTKHSIILIQPHGVLFTRAVFAFNESIISLWNIYEEPKFSEVSC